MTYSNIPHENQCFDFTEENLQECPTDCKGKDSDCDWCDGGAYVTKSTAKEYHCQTENNY